MKLNAYIFKHTEFGETKVSYFIYFQNADGEEQTQQYDNVDDWISEYFELTNILNKSTDHLTELNKELKAIGMKINVLEESIKLLTTKVCNKAERDVPVLILSFVVGLSGGIPGIVYLGNIITEKLSDNISHGNNSGATQNHSPDDKTMECVTPIHLLHTSDPEVMLKIDSCSTRKSTESNNFDIIHIPFQWYDLRGKGEMLYYNDYQCNVIISPHTTLPIKDYKCDNETSVLDNTTPWDSKDGWHHYGSVDIKYNNIFTPISLLDKISIFFIELDVKLIRRLLLHEISANMTLYFEKDK